MGSTPDKRVTLDEIAGEIGDGMTVGIGGWGSRRKPMAIVRALLRSPAKDLTLVTYGGPDVGLLCRAGKVKRVVYAFVSLDSIPLEPHFRKARQSGQVATTELDEGMFLLGLQAAAWRVPFLPTRCGLGSDIMAANPELVTVRSPYRDGSPWGRQRASERPSGREPQASGGPTHGNGGERSGPGATQERDGREGAGRAQRASERPSGREPQASGGPTHGNGGERSGPGATQERDGREGAGRAQRASERPSGREPQASWGGGEQLVAMPALELDVALVHMHRGDQGGNGQFLNVDPYFDDLMCLAANQAFMSVERIVPTEELASNGSVHTLRVNRLMVSGVVETPNGAHFTECPPDYARDEAFQREYAATAKSDEAWDAFRARYLDVTEVEYQAAVADG